MHLFAHLVLHILCVWIYRLSIGVDSVIVVIGFSLFSSFRLSFGGEIGISFSSGWIFLIQSCHFLIGLSRGSVSFSWQV